MKKILIVLALILVFFSTSLAADYTITLSDLENQAVAYKAKKEKKTKVKLFDDYVIGTLIASWIREMLDAESLTLKEKYEKATEGQKTQIRKILGVE